MKFRMMKRNLQFRSSLTGVCSILLMLCASQAGLAQQSTPVKPSAAAPAAVAPAAKPPAAQAKEEEKEATSPAKQGSNGIRIHGHWKFVVHNADGSLASEKEFENALVTPGAGDYLIASALLGQTVPVDWAVVLCPVAGSTWAVTGGICPGNNVPIAVLVPSTNTIAGQAMYNSNSCNLNTCISGLRQGITGGTSSTPSYSITLSGTYTSPVPAQINAVGTYTGLCPALGPGQFSTTSASVCEGSFVTNYPPYPANNPIMLPFTGTNQTQSLGAGQILQVTVTISFS